MFLKIERSEAAQGKEGGKNFCATDPERSADCNASQNGPRGISSAWPDTNGSWHDFLLCVDVRAEDTSGCVWLGNDRLLTGVRRSFSCVSILAVHCLQGRRTLGQARAAETSQTKADSKRQRDAAMLMMQTCVDLTPRCILLCDHKLGTCALDVVIFAHFNPAQYQLLLSKITIWRYLIRLRCYDSTST
jgi:hypothetical protein